MDVTGDSDSLRPTLFIIVMLRPLVSSVAPAPPRPPFPSSYLEKRTPAQKITRKFFPLLLLLPLQQVWSQLFGCSAEVALHSLPPAD